VYNPSAYANPLTDLLHDGIDALLSLGGPALWAVGGLLVLVAALVFLAHKVS